MAATEQKVNHDEVREEFKTIGVLSRQYVLDRARAETSNLHKYFDWTDSTAAEKYRLEQAGVLLRTVKLHVTYREPLNGRAVVSIKTNDKREYVPVDVALSNRDMRAQLRERAIRELRGWLQKYEPMEDLSMLTVGVREILAALDRKRRREG